MKRRTIILYSLLALLGAGSCTTEHKTEYELPDDPTAIYLSTPQVVFEAEGGRKSVVVETSGPQYEIATAVPDWLTAERENDLLILSAGANAAEETLKADLQLTAGSDAAAVSRTLRVVQLGRPFADLSADGTANCYVVSPGGSYRFRATVKGSGNAVSDPLEGASGLSVYVARYGTQIEGARAAQLLWETVPDGDLTSSYDVIDGEPLFGNGFIYFSTGRHAGNAVIAVCDASGTILWSWHIWSTAERIGTSRHNGFTWLDRNLGALSNVPGEISNRGLLYQWGRKDPIPASCAPYGDPTPDRINTAWGDGILPPDNVGIFATPYWEAPGNIAYAIRHPTTFLAYAGYNSKDWYSAAHEDQTGFNSLLWGDPASEAYAKSIFDPCPPGYVVAPDGAFASGRDTALQGWSAAENFGRYWSDGNGDFFPFAGYALGLAGDQPLYVCGTSGAYWVANPFPESVSSLFLQLTDEDAVQGQTYRMYGLSIRCVAEK